MSDDSLSEMPEFQKPAESEPIVIIPDQPAEKPKCAATKKDGSPCQVPPLKGEKYCLGHSKSLSPELRDKWRRLGAGVAKTQRTLRRKQAHYSKDELLGILSERLDLVADRFGGMCNVEVEEMFCNIVRTMAVVYRLDQPEADKNSAGWRMKGAV